MPETIGCPLCGGGGPKLFVRDWGKYRLYDCAECGVGFCLPFKNPGPEFYAQFEDLYPHQAQKSTDAMSEEYDECLNSFPGDVRPQRLLDVGCGGGGFLYRARNRGFQVTGIDFDKARLDLIRSGLGIEDVFCGSIDDFARARPGDRFDAITMFEVLEHLDDPARWLDAARSLLKPGGRLFLGVPNRDRTFDPFQGPGMEELDNPPHHLTRWSVKALERFVEGRSFEIMKIKSLGVPRPLFALLLRNRLRFGLATRALNVDQIRHAPAGKELQPGSGMIRFLVFAKEAVINGFSFLLYPVFVAAFKLFGWRGVILFCEARVRAQSG